MQILTIKTYKYRCYPTKSQISRLENHFSMCRHLYNWSLKDRIEHYQSTGKTLSYNKQQNALPSMKVERPWYKNVHSQVLQNVLIRLDEAYKAFFRRVKEGTEAPGFPKFKKRGNWSGITYPQHSKKPENSKIYVPSIGTIRLVYHREIPKDADVKTLSIVKEAGKWFVCFSAEVLVLLEPKLKPSSPVGIDMGLENFLYTSNGDQVDPPKYFRKREKQLKRLQRRLAKAKKRSPKYFRILRAIQKCHYRIKCQRTDFLHKQANALLATSDIIFHEDLSIRNMIRRPKPKPDGNGGYLPNGAAAKSGINKSIADVGWHRFFEIMRYKADALGKIFFPVPPEYTSQECNACHAIVKKSLSTRTHFCHECGYIAHRDLNAAYNILRVGMHTLQRLLFLLLLEAPSMRSA